MLYGDILISLLFWEDAGDRFIKWKSDDLWIRILNDEIFHYVASIDREVDDLGRLIVFRRYIVIGIGCMFEY